MAQSLKVIVRPVLIGRVLDPQIRLRVTCVRSGFGTDGGLEGSNR